MKLKNRKTGKIVTAATYRCGSNCSIELVFAEEDQPPCEYNSLAELCEEWSDYEEPKGFWIIDVFGIVEYQKICDIEPAKIEFMKSIGNYFETEAEAEKAVEKLTALTILKDKRLRFDGWTIDDGLRVSICTNIDGESIYDDSKKELRQNLDLLFSGGEE